MSVDLIMTSMHDFLFPKTRPVYGNWVTIKGNAVAILFYFAAQSANQF